MQYPRSSYIIYTLPRSGSNLLCEALTRTKVAGKPMEYIMVKKAHLIHSEQWGMSLPDTGTDLTEAYFQHMYATATPNGVFGLKLMWEYVPYCLDQIHKLAGNSELSAPECLETAFPQHRAILLTRQDKVRQAISWWKAFKTDVWYLHSKKTGDETRLKLKFDFQEVEMCRQLLVSYEQALSLYFLLHGIRPFRVVYEDFATTYEQTTFQILDYLHIPVPKDLVLSEPGLQKQADEQTEEWVQHYYQIQQERTAV